MTTQSTLPAQGQADPERAGEPAGDDEAPHVAGLFVYPLKSAAGVTLETVEVDECGLRMDRRWMMVDAEGRFLSQRTHPRMALLRARLGNGVLRLSFPGQPLLELPLEASEPEAETTVIRVWREDRHGADCGVEAAAWATAVMGARCRIVRAVPPRAVPPISDAGRVRTTFADGFPALVVSTSSLADLNARLHEPLSMDRFRPNVVVAGVAPYEEETWGRVRAGEVVLRGIRPCPRCAIPTVDQATGTVTGPEPLKTLATYRRTDDGKVVFGMNVGFEGPGVLRVGDPLGPS